MVLLKFFKVLFLSLLFTCLIWLALGYFVINTVMVVVK